MDWSSLEFVSHKSSSAKVDLNAHCKEDVFGYAGLQALNWATLSLFFGNINKPQTAPRLSVTAIGQDGLLSHNSEGKSPIT